MKHGNIKNLSVCSQLFNETPRDLQSHRHTKKLRNTSWNFYIICLPAIYSYQFSSKRFSFHNVSVIFSLFQKHKIRHSPSKYLQKQTFSLQTIFFVHLRKWTSLIIYWLLYPAACRKGLAFVTEITWKQISL